MCRSLNISKCCWVIGLRNSGYLIGLFQFVLGAALMTYELINPSDNKRKTAHDGDTIATDQKVDLTFFYIVISLVFILLGVILIFGVRIKNVVVIKVYIIFEIICLSIGFICLVIILLHLILAYAIASSDTTNIVGEFIKILATVFAQVLGIGTVVLLVLLVLMTYFLICVNAYLKELIALKTGTPQVVAYTAVIDNGDKNIKV